MILLHRHRRLTLTVVVERCDDRRLTLTVKWRQLEEDGDDRYDEANHETLEKRVSNKISISDYCDHFIREPTFFPPQFGFC